MKVVIAALVSAFSIGGVLAQEYVSAIDIVRKAKEAFRAAKTAEEGEAIRHWCTENIEALSLAERDRLLGQALKKMQEHKEMEATVLVKKVDALRVMNSTFAESICVAE
jgi:hypothetical protein